MKPVNEAVDAVRKGKVHTWTDLKQTRWLWPRNDRSLKVKQKKQLQELLKEQNLRTSQAYPFRLTFQDIFTIRNRHQGATLLKAWMENARDSGIAAHGQGRLQHPESLGRCAPLAQEPDHQRDSGRLQQTHPIRQGESPGLSHA